MTVYGKVARLNPIQTKENCHSYPNSPITIFGKAQKGPPIRQPNAAESAPIKDKPQIEQLQDNHPVGDKAVSLMGTLSAMLRVVAAQTQRLQIP